MLLDLIFSFLLLFTVDCFPIYPVTDDMRSAAKTILSTLLPPEGVTDKSSNPWQRLAYITDTFGPRFSGSQSLEDALTWIRDTAISDGLYVTEMPTYVKKWVRGEEFAYLLEPRKKKLHMVGLGMSSGGNVTAEVFVVSGNAELKANCSKAEGKIVLFNTIFTTYGATVPSRTNAAIWASSCGGIGALIRSITPFSMQSPHTGSSQTGTIPAAAISLEDASQIQRMFDRGQKPVVHLYMESKLEPPSLSRNIIIDLVGSEFPDEYVLVSGHGDSWDITEGAMDDGGGFVSSWEAVRVLKQLGLQPKRTIRAVVWVNEENGVAGGNQYLNDSPPGLLLNHSIAIETDIGSFQPWGIGVSCTTDGSSQGGCEATRAQLSLIGKELLSSIGSGHVDKAGGEVDIGPICNAGVPCTSLHVIDHRLSSGENNPCVADSQGAWPVPVSLNPSVNPYDSGYFFYHHSDSDTMERIDPKQLNQVTATLAIWTYSIAQLPTLLPRDAYPDSSPDSQSSSSSSHLLSLASWALIGGGIALIIIAGLALLHYFSKSSSANKQSISDINYSPVNQDIPQNSEPFLQPKRNSKSFPQDEESQK